MVKKVGPPLPIPITLILLIAITYTSATIQGQQIKRKSRRSRLSRTYGDKQGLLKKASQ